MNKQYFVEVKGKQKGPFTFEQLSALQINENTMVWTAGLDDWVKAIDLEELSSLVTTIPPPLPAKRYPIETEPIIIAVFSIIFYLFVAPNPPESIKGQAIIVTCLFILRIYSVYIAVKISKGRKQDSWTWGFMAILFPSITLLVLGFMRPKI